MGPKRYKRHACPGSRTMGCKGVRGWLGVWELQEDGELGEWCRRMVQEALRYPPRMHRLGVVRADLLQAAAHVEEVPLSSLWRELRAATRGEAWVGPTLRSPNRPDRLLRWEPLWHGTLSRAGPQEAAGAPWRLRPTGSSTDRAVARDRAGIESPRSIELSAVEGAALAWAGRFRRSVWEELERSVGHRPLRNDPIRH